MPTAIITGVTGQDGAYLSQFLLAKGYKIIGLIPESRQSTTFRLRYLDVLDKVKLVSVNLLDQNNIISILENEKPDEIYNLAALSSVGNSFKKPFEAFEFNSMSVLNLLEAIRSVSPKVKFYQASSSEMFGNIGEDKLPLKESFLFHPVSPYGISKASAHWLAVNYREAFKLKSCCGILFNHESSLRPPHFVIKKIIRSAIDIQRGNANKLELGNVSVIRDFGYAPFFVEAMWRMLQRDDLTEYLICSGNKISLQEFVNLVFQLLDLDVYDHVITDSSLMRELDLKVIFGDNSKAKKELQWEYDLSNFDLIKQLIADEIHFMDWEDRNLIK